MKYRLELSRTFVVLAVVVVAAMPTTAMAQQPEYFQTVNQTEFATAVYAAILDVSVMTVDSEQALWALQKEGLLDSAWGGEDVVKIGEAVEVFGKMGIQLQPLSRDDERPLSSSMLESILRTHRGAIKANRLEWNINHKFSRSITLGVYRERVVSPSGF